MSLCLPSTAHSPVTRGRRTHFPPAVCVSCPTPQCLHRLWKCEAEPPRQAGMDRAEHREGAGCVPGTQAGREGPAPSPCCVISLQGSQKPAPGSALISLEPSHVQALPETGRHTDNLQHSQRLGLSAKITGSWHQPAMGSTGMQGALGAAQQQLLALYDSQDSPTAPEGRGCACSAGTGAQTQLCLIHCPFPEVWALPAGCLPKERTQLSTQRRGWVWGAAPVLPTPGFGAIR